MPGAYWSLRRVAMVGVAVGSVVGAAAMVGKLQVGQLSTAHLLVILALAILPGATFAAWCLDRKHKRESIVEDNGLFEMPEGVQVVEEEMSEHQSMGMEDSLEPEQANMPRRMHQPHRRRRAGRMSRRG